MKSTICSGTVCLGLSVLRASSATFSMKTLITIAGLLCTVLTAGAQTMQLTVLTSFDRPGGSSPRGNLVQGPDGNLYGTTD
jgi:hypothetical protein